MAAFENSKSFRLAPRKSTWCVSSLRINRFSYRYTMTLRLRYESRFCKAVNVCARICSNALAVLFSNPSSRRIPFTSSMYSLKVTRRMFSSTCRWSWSRVARAEASCCREKAMVNTPKTMVGRAARTSLRRIRHLTFFRCFTGNRRRLRKARTMCRNENTDCGLRWIRVSNDFFGAFDDGRLIDRCQPSEESDYQSKCISSRLFYTTDARNKQSNFAFTPARQKKEPPIVVSGGRLSFRNIYHEVQRARDWRWDTTSPVERIQKPSVDHRASKDPGGIWLRPT